MLDAKVRHRCGIVAALIIWALPLGANASPTTSLAATPTQTNPAEPDVAAPRIRINAMSRLRVPDSVADEVRATARKTLEDAGFVVVEDADILVQIIITRSDSEATDYQVYFGYSMSSNDQIRSGPSFVCPRCSATGLLEGVERGALDLAAILRDPKHEQRNEPTEAPAEPSAEPEPTTAEPAADDEPTALLRKRRGFGLLASGMALSIVGGAALVGTSAAVAVDASDGHGLDPRGLIVVGISGAMTLVGVPLLVVGAKRMRAPSRSPRVGFVPSRHGSMFVLSGRF